MPMSVEDAARVIAADKRGRGPVLMSRLRTEQIGGTAENRRWNVSYEMSCFQGSFCDHDHGGDEKCVAVETTDAALAEVGLAIDDAGKLVRRDG